ncbi:MAG: cardiolipin synthase ClsB [Deltaproteobacteria bacterium]|nr:cardiolipin synthase ClsB [Deltaproteobacteria bacterium]
MEWKRYCSDHNQVDEGNTIDLLEGGNATFETMLSAIEGAERFVSLATFIFAPDRTGRRFLDALLRARERGVEVRLIIDGVGCLETPRSFLRPLKAAGGEIHVYHRLDPWRLKFVIWHRMHRKNLVVDGRVGFCGGLNIHDRCLPIEDGGGGWHDIHARIEGPAVRSLHRSFLNTWIRVLGPPSSDHELLPRPGARGNHPVQVITAGGKRRGKRKRMIQRAYQHAIKNAQRTIHLWNPYFIPNRGVRRALRNACSRGVDVRVIVPARGNHPAVHLASENLYAKLMRYGMRILRWPGPMMHAKTAVIDSTWSTVGSYNLDAQSHLHNLELNVTVYGERFGEALEALFVRDTEQCVEVDNGNWSNRSLVDRLLQKLCYGFRRWL